MVYLIDFTWYVYRSWLHFILENLWGCSELQAAEFCKVSYFTSITSQIWTFYDEQQIYIEEECGKVVVESQKTVYLEFSKEIS